MLKVRYSRIRLPMSLDAFVQMCAKWRPTEKSSRLSVVGRGAREVVMNYVVIRYLTVTELMDDGAQVKRPVPTMDQHTFRIFQGRDQTYLSILNPGRGGRAVERLLDDVLGGEQYFIEPLEINSTMIDRHIKKFAATRLVSAKVKDFKVYDSAVGRLEITSKDGLPSEIAPFLAGKFHRIDSLTYEVTHGLVQGLIWYSSGGTVRMSGPLAEIAFPLFEAEL